ncbi:DNA-binding domain-containing protein [Shewanella pneumatophori]|uniref:DNA-binding domain-containing protein n=1 Tax=Shewanella pneumatophori TaxID=314092 RepID=A0A9X1ZDZ9_9GAMM|nr:DNA-binding domain-containing protein [Shewanella pneumatophori]MCL1140514.1 DNA-binding domain-containing protein [Shewanella pneumatophori]
MRLAQWQSAFVNALAPQQSDASLLDLVTNEQKQRFHIYQNNAFQAQLNALQQTFPVCHIVVGELCFSQLAKRYTLQYPLRDLNLNSYGQNFPGWLTQEITNYSAFKDLAYLGELAQLEWQINQSYYAMDSDSFMLNHNELAQLASLADAAQQQAILLLSPAVSLLNCGFPVEKIWQKYQSHRASHAQVEQDSTSSNSNQAKDEQGPAEQLSNEKLRDKHRHLVIYRQQYQSKVCSVEPNQMQLLQAIASQQTLAELTASEIDLNLLTELIERQWLCGFSLQQLDDVTEDG